MLVYGNRRFLKAAGDPPKVGKGAADIMKLCCQSLRRGMDRYRVGPSAHDGLNCRSGGQFRDSV